MKPYQQISLNFGFEEPAAPEVSVTPDKEIPRAKEVRTAVDKAPVKIPLVDESTVLTIRKKPGRKEKEKAWKSATSGKRGRKSLKDIAAEVDLIEIPADEQLYSKQYYSIGDVANMFRMNPSLIRTWSNEFAGMLHPRKNRKGDRHFRPDDVKFLHLIYHLIRVRKFTLEGAKEHLKLQKKKTEKQFAVIQALQNFKSFLLELKTNL
ncbi:MerR family transcriptional regulator [Flavihumibacter profundi]|jgi:DNA-binding transcriptional MerR regulator|uniref:MerR family transcriptional regulator n=1 Tax=Flavihumibacter profundi TaxID=2716883 RepID=UPI001CC43C41|nr:MerR family transcriptional regulator [Flavihumibacter profundi]MBZ5858625.1 MerR family transcriptional regulator [Flavihumibacter profundi]